MSKLRDIEETMLRHGDPVVSVPELAEQMDRSDTHIREQLRLLEREGAVASKDVGARATAWWHVGRVQPPTPENWPTMDEAVIGDEAGSLTAGQDALEDARREAIEKRLETDERHHGAPDGPHSAESEDGLEDVDFPDSREREECVAAVEAAREYLREDGPATMRDIVTSVGPEHPVGYDVPEEIEAGERYRGAWWRTIVKPGLEALEDVEAPPTGGSDWRTVE